MLQRPDRDAEHAGRQPRHRRQVRHRHRRRRAVFLQEMLQAAGRALGVAGDDYAPTGAIGRRYMLRHLIEQIDTLPGPGLGKTLVAAAMEVDRDRRFAIFREAETLLIQKEAVISPVWHYVGVQFYWPDRLAGVQSNLVDEHPFRCMRWI